MTHRPHSRVAWTALAGAAAAALVVGAASTGAVEPVSDAYDGRYAGEARVNEALSDPSCKGKQPFAVNITGGKMHGGPKDAGQVGAIVTSDGFFTGRYWPSKQGKANTFEGLIEKDGTVVGGYFTDDGKCAWLVKLSRTRG